MAMKIPTNTIIDKVFSCFKKITPALVAVSLASGAVLFLPKNILELLGLNKLTSRTTTAIGVVFLLSTTLIITIVLSSWWQIVNKKVRYIKIRRRLKRRFLALAPEQKEIILELLENKDKCIELENASGNTTYLRDNNFIYRPEQMIEPGYDNELYFKFVPHPWLIDLYNNEPEIFK